MQLTFILPAFLNSAPCAKIILGKMAIFFVPNSFKLKYLEGLCRLAQMQQVYFRNRRVLWAASILALNVDFFTKELKADQLIRKKQKQWL